MFRHGSLLIILFFAQAALALEKLPPPSTPSGGTLYSFVRVILGIVIKIAAPALVVALVFFAFQMVAATGDEKTLSETKRRLMITLGVAAIFLGLGLIATIIYNTGSSIGYVQPFPSSPAPVDPKFDAIMNTKLFN